MYVFLEESHYFLDTQSEVNETHDLLQNNPWEENGGVSSWCRLWVHGVATLLTSEMSEISHN